MTDHHSPEATPPPEESIEEIQARLAEADAADAPAIAEELARRLSTTIDTDSGGGDS